MLSVDERKRVDVNKAKIAQHKERIRRLRKLSEGKDSEFWNNLKSEVEAGLEGARQQLEVLSIREDAEDLAILGAQVKAVGRSILVYKGILADVDHADVKVNALNSRIADLNRDIERLAEKDTEPVAAGESNKGRRTHV